MQTVLDALRARKDRFMFEGNDIALRNSVMAFITMNPGYPGRAELPESLKVLHFAAVARTCLGIHVGDATLPSADVNWQRVQCCMSCMQG